MKLGDALSERARLQRKISELRERINANTAVRTDENAAEDANDLLAEVEAVTNELKDLIVGINLTNANTKVDGASLTELLAARDCAASLAATYNGAADAAQQRGDRHSMFGRGDTPVELTVNVATLRNSADEALVQMRQIDSQIQAANWNTEI